MLEILNDNKLFLGIMLIIINIWSRYLVDELSTNPEEYNRNLVLRRIAVFAVCFVGTRDVVVSLLLTAGFIIIAQGVSSRSREGMENKKKMEEKQKDYDFEERMKELREEEEKAKAYKKEKQKEKKRRAEEDLTFEEDDEMAAVMGFSGFGSTKKSY